MRKKLHGLKKIQLRQSWHKYNLYNIARNTLPRIVERTLFWQKWNARSMTRAYHTERLQEKKWQRLFKAGTRSVVPLDHKYLAHNDGSEQAAGRGSGKEKPPDEQLPPTSRTPYLSMAYAPLERRLDTAVFRALFASSARAARQLVIHGWVKVNGKKMIYPGYQLNPGDMFQVDPERVMHATGAPKNSNERRAGRMLKAKDATKAPVSSEVDEGSEGDSNAEESPLANASENPANNAPEKETPSIKDLIKRSKDLLSDPSPGLTPKRKQELRALQRSLRQALRPGSNLEAELNAKFQEVNLRINPPAAPVSRAAPIASSEDVPELETLSLREELNTLDPDQIRSLRTALIEAKENPIDPSKPYATPWRPRDYMSAFAFIPRYLEVHPRVCAAVYIRHPVARPGLAEVPSPYGPELLQLAHNWYLRRRRAPSIIRRQSLVFYQHSGLLITGD